MQLQLSNKIIYEWLRGPNLGVSYLNIVLNKLTLFSTEPTDS